MPDASASNTIDPVAKIAADVAAETERSLAELKERSRDYADVAGEQFDVAQRYVVDRVQERPVAATLAALGVGVLLGYLIAGRKQ